MKHTRDHMMATIRSRNTHVDLLVIGGGANGAGVALDAAARGLSTVLLERSDFGSGTSSRSSKLIHGGVRYLALGQWSLVREALNERAVLLKNAASIVRPTRFLIPAYSRLELAKFRLGLQLYDMLADSQITRPSELVSPAGIADRVPTLARGDLRGGVEYDDAVFDDCGLLLSILRRARELGAATINYAEVLAVQPSSRRGGRSRVVVADRLDGREFEIHSRAVINAAGPHTDQVRSLEEGKAEPALTASQGTHIVVGEAFLAASSRAVVFPRTDDGRIMFATPWHGHTLLGTTEAPVVTPTEAPRPSDPEIDQILTVAGRFLDPAPTRSDILSVFAGIRPLKRSPGKTSTARISREHNLTVSAGGMVTVAGGKWTTYRLIAEQAVDLAASFHQLHVPISATRQIDLASDDAAERARILDKSPELGERLDPGLPYCGVDFVMATRRDLALRVGDALAYRTRAMFLNAAAASTIAARVAALMASELGRDDYWVVREVETARQMASEFMPDPIPTPTLS